MTLWINNVGYYKKGINMKKLSELVKEVNRDNAPPDGWKKEDILKGTIICKAKKCDKYLYKNESTSLSGYCIDCG